jgi:predicted acetyltransferase
MIHDFLSNRSYWAKNKSVETVEKSIQNFLCFGVFIENKQVGFARVVTDYSVFVWIMDVFILEAYRKNGLGKKLLNIGDSEPKMHMDSIASLDLQL